MKDLPIHLALFAAISLAIVTTAAIYAQPSDRAAFLSIPRRFAVFVLGCGILAAVMLAVEHLFAGVN